MVYVGLQSQIWRNNFKSTLLLIGFPSLILILSWLFFFIIGGGSSEDIYYVNNTFFNAFPWITGAVLLWFTIAYFFHSKMLEKATGSKSLERKENGKVYNLVENLCISRGVKMPKINIIDDDSLNAFASGISESTYTISLSKGIINKLNKKELEAVIAHELGHIMNKDVRLLIISIVFVGIFAFAAESVFRGIFWSSRGGDNKKSGKIVIVALVLAIIGYLISIIFKFALSRKREFLADAFSAETTKDPLALASALEKISKDPRIESVKRKDVAQLFIENPQEKKKGMFSFFNNMFATHPPIEERIKVLKGL